VAARGFEDLKVLRSKKIGVNRRWLGTLLARSRARDSRRDAL
jgi:hypothetical protein